jgi:glycosyltransferase involved in cell wall biosynthesis
VFSVYRALRNESFDVAVVKTAHDWRTLLRDITAAFVIRRRCRPLVLHLHGSNAAQLVEPGRRAFKLATRLLLRLVDGLLVLSTEEQRQWRSFREQPRVFPVKNAYVSVFPALAPQAADTSSEPFRVLFVGRLIAAKGIFDLVDALPRVLEHVACRLEIVGEGDQEPELRDRVRRLGLDDHVTIAGYLTGDALASRYREATVFVLPSWDEGFPTVLAEAMDAGLPIVTTRIRGAADHLVDTENTIFVAPRDVRGLAAAIAALLGDEALRVRMGAANRKLVEMFEPLAVAAEYRDILEMLVRSVTAGDQARGTDQANPNNR